MLDEIHRIVLMTVGSHAKNNRQFIFGPGKFLEGNVHFVTGVKAEIEAQHGLDRSHGAGKILADILGLEHGEVSIHHVQPVAARACELRLSPRLGG